MNAVVEQPRHWERGPSGADRIMACPGCVEEQAKYPSDPSGEAAIAGTHRHTLAEQCIVNGVWDARCYLNDPMTDHDGSFVVEQSMVEDVNVCLAYVKARVDELVTAKLEPEVVVDAGAPYEIEGWKGTADLIIVCMTFLEVIDFKFGFKVVPPTSWQPVSYTIGAINRQPDRMVEKIRNTILQPKNFKSQVSFVEYTPAEFAPKVEQMVEGMRASMVPGAPRNPGDHCKYCSGAKPARCAAFNSKVISTVNDAFANVPAAPGVMSPAAPAPGALTLPTIDDTLSDEKLAAILDAKELVQQFLKEADAEALKRFQGGNAIPNYKVIRGSGQRKYVHEDDELRGKFKSMGLNQSDYTEDKIKSPAGIEKTEKYRGWSKRKKENFAKLYSKSQGGLKVVKETEPGTPVLFDTKAVFKDLPPAPDAAARQPLISF